MIQVQPSSCFSVVKAHILVYMQLCLSVSTKHHNRQSVRHVCADMQGDLDMYMKARFTESMIKASLIVAQTLVVKVTAIMSLVYILYLTVQKLALLCYIKSRPQRRGYLDSSFALFPPL